MSASLTYDLASAATATFVIALVGGMIDALSRDYANTTAMILATAPEFDAVLASINEIDCTIT